MKCSVIQHAGQLEHANLLGKTVVVIDVFRATSVMVEGLFNEGLAFIPVKTIEEAKFLKSKNSSIVLGGERNGVKIDGFELDNSPLSYTIEAVGGKEIVLTTTNGTRALAGTVGADAVYLGAFLNISAVARKVVDVTELVLVCSGSNDAVSLEDSVCAGAILYHLELLTSVEWTDDAFMLKSLYLYTAPKLKDYLSSGSHFKDLEEKGFSMDLDFCLQFNKRPVVPYYDGTAVRL